jgi:hypothetical protein
MDGFSSTQLYKTDPSVSQNSRISSLKLSQISTRELADLVPYESMIFLKKYGICFQTNKQVYCEHCRVFFKCQNAGLSGIWSV